MYQMKANPKVFMGKTVMVTNAHWRVMRIIGRG